MLSETIPTTRLENREAGINRHKKNDSNSSRVCNGRNENLVSVGTSAFDDEKNGVKRASRISDSELTENTNGNLQSDVVSKKRRQQREMTFQDMYDKEYSFGDDEDDSDWEPVRKPVDREPVQKPVDREPVQKPVEVEKWFCVNCTGENLDGVVYCNICKEHKESGILKHGFFATPLLKEADLSPNEAEMLEKYRDSLLRISASENSTAVGFDERMLLHSEVEMKSYPHPERPDRLRAILTSLANAGIFPGRCSPIPAREITREELLLVHSMKHIQTVDITSQNFARALTKDTYVNEHSATAARLAAGLCADLASAIFSGRAKNGFALVRPPGHHAGVSDVMGFCLHNNAAVAALAAQVAGAKKVLILDWDVHHGNGTQEIFDGNKSVLYISLHRHEGGLFYPCTGAAHEVGTMGAEGYCVNVPWSCSGVGDNDYIFAFQNVVMPIASAFAPDFTIISAGFDAARGDPLGCCDVTPDGYAQMTHMLNALSGGKLLVILEGGYNLRSISSSATAVIKVLLGEIPKVEVNEVIPTGSGLLTVMEVLKIQMDFWPNLEPILSELLSKWGKHVYQEDTEKRHCQVAPAPACWRFGRKRWLFDILSMRRRRKSRRFFQLF